MSDLNKLPQPAAGCLPAGVTDQNGKNAFILRFGTATKEAVATGSISHTPNTDLTKFPDGLGTYTKALKQTSAGIVDSGTFDQFLKACGVKPGGPLGDFENANIKLGGTNKLNDPLGAFALQLVGKDSRGFGDPIVPTPPALDSVEYAIELVELYWASLLRDVPFTEYDTDATANAAANELSALAAAHPGKYAGPLDGSGKVTPDLLFRGGFNAHPAYFAGETDGPYISQFCLLPTFMGRVPLDQKIKTLVAGKDFMTTQSEWENIQQGIAPSEIAVFDDHHRYIHTGRDTASYTQVDELYQAYLIAYLVCSTLGIGANPHSPYVSTFKKEKAFGTFGGPDITATLGAVARAAINAVWYQKWLVHLRHRPESGGGIVQLLKSNMLNPMDAAKLGNFNIVLNSAALNLSNIRNGSFLLSQAFPEGSPTHPAYPTGHGTVGGACITVLKFFLDGGQSISNPIVPSLDGLTLEPYVGPGHLTVNGELHKLAHNISFGHGIHAGIHWRSDTDYSLLLGEAIAISFLEDQMWTYEEEFNISIKKMDGTTHHFKNH